MISLGDWTPQEPMQGISLTRLHGDLYDLRAVGVMSGLAPEAVPLSGVLVYASRSAEYTAIITATHKQITGFARYYGGVATKTQGGWVIKAIAPKMRQEIAQ